MVEREFLGFKIMDEPIGEVIARINSDRVFPPACKVLVTPNVDHFSMLYGVGRNESFCAAYSSASVVICDSRIIRILSYFLGDRIKNVVPGSDLTKRLLEEKWLVSSKICVIGGAIGELDYVSSVYRLRDLTHYNPPMGFMDVPGEVDKCVDFVLASNAEYVFLAVGSPRQELLASRIKEKFSSSGDIRFIFCVGASFNFLSGKTSRAPKWMQVMCLEWLHRALLEPKRMVPRYFNNFVWICRLIARHMLKKGA